jgi:predicted deacylase
MSEYLIVNKKKIFPGENQVIKLNVARLPSGTVINLRIHVYRSKNPGPAMLVMGGVHGDEINGVEIVRRTIEQGLFESLSAGSVIAIPLLNIYGFINFSRDVSEGKDVNRMFPGNMSGSLASRVAATLTKHVLPAVDFGLDFHTGGGSRYNYPQIRYSKSDKKAEELANIFAAPYLLCKANIPKSLRKVAMGLKKSILVYEGGEALRFDGLSIENGLAGLKRVMHSQGMIETAPAPLVVPKKINKTSWLRASRSGIFLWWKQSGEKVKAGEQLGVINDPYGEFAVRIIAKRNGYIIGHNNAPVVSQGDALFHIGYDDEKK